MTRTKDRIIIFLILSTVFIFYLFGFKGFFQQDEWLAFGNAFALKNTTFIQIINSFLSLKVGHYNPLRDILFQFIFSMVHINFSVWYFLSLVEHLIVTFLVFKFSQELVRNKLISYLAALIFGLSVTGSQATIWLATSLNTHWATFFAILSAIYFIKFVKDLKNKYLYVSIFLWFISLLFKEVAIFLPFMYFVFTFLSFKKQIKKFYYWVVILSSESVYFLLKVFSFFVNRSNVSTNQVVTQSQSIKDLIYDIVSFPIKGFVQTIFPSDFILAISRTVASYLPKNISGTPGTTAFDVFVEKRAFEFFNYFLFIVIAIVLINFYKKIKDKNTKNAIIFCVIFIIFNSIIYAFSPGVIGYISILDSRNLYLLNIASSILLSFVVYHVYQQRKKIGILLTLIVLFLNIFYLLNNFNLQNNNGSLRKNILNQIISDYPRLPKKVVFYTASDHSFYGLPSDEKIMPFQSGFGQTLLIWYESRQDFPVNFFKNNFLWDIESQGYQEINGVGFGYFRNFDDLARAIIEDKLDTSSVISFDYNSQTMVLNDTTKTVREELDGYLSAKEIVENNSYFLQSMNDSQEIIEFKKPIDIAEIDMGIYNSSYTVFISKDGKKWIEIPGVYFEPTTVRFIKILSSDSNTNVNEVFQRLKIYEKISTN